MDLLPLPRTRLALHAAGAVAALLLLTGCGLRLETPEPEPLVPDELEIVRADNAAAAANLRAMAEEAAAGAPPEVSPVLARIATSSAAHHDALGGTYEPFPDAPPTPTPTATSAPTPPALPQDVLAALTAGAAAARSDADAAVDGPMARLLAAISVNRWLLADELATALGTVAGPKVAFVVPTELPEGMTVQQATVLVQSEDAAGLAWEVVAARSLDADRDRAAARAAAHRERAQAWAEASGVAGAGADPRRSAYALPEALGDAAATPGMRLAALGEVEGALADSYMSLVAHAPAGARAALMDGVLDGVRAQVAGGAAVPAFPGLAEQG
jgi:hypothetical protein